jgi:hypothetical protein
VDGLISGEGCGVGGPGVGDPATSSHSFIIAGGAVAYWSLLESESDCGGVFPFSKGMETVRAP